MLADLVHSPTKLSAITWKNGKMPDFEFADRLLVRFLWELSPHSTTGSNARLRFGLSAAMRVVSRGILAHT